MRSLPSKTKIKTARRIVREVKIVRGRTLRRTMIGRKARIRIGRLHSRVVTIRMEVIMVTLPVGRRTKKILKRREVAVRKRTRIKSKTVTNLQRVMQTSLIQSRRHRVRAKMRRIMASRMRRIKKHLTTHTSLQKPLAIAQLVEFHIFRSKLSIK